MAEAAAAAQVDRSTVLRIREVAKQGALAALSESRPGGATSFPLDQLRHETRRATRHGSALAVLFLSVEGLVPLVKQHGGCGADRLLVEYSARMSQALRRSDVLARFGAHQFAVLCPALGEEPGQRTGGSAPAPTRPAAAASRHVGPAAAGAVQAARRLSQACAAAVSRTAPGPPLRTPLVIAGR